VRFEFATATRIIFGAGTLKHVPEAASQMGRRPLLVTGRQREASKWLADALRETGLEPVTMTVTREPTTESLPHAVDAAREAGCDSCIAIGGGSVIDTGKAVAALLANGGDLLDYLEVIGRGTPLRKPSVPFVALPTTAGTGSEVTRNAVIGSPTHRVKVSMRSPHMLPALAVVDPELTHSVPPDVTASTGLDALTQLIEPFVTPRSNPMVQALCREGMVRAARALPRVVADGQDAAARADMALASLFGGLALANAGLGAVHGFAGPLGGMLDAPHGALCASLLPPVMEMTLRALASRAPDNPAIALYDEVARILTGDPAARALEGIAWVRQLCARLKTPPLRELGLAERQIPAAVAQSRKASSMKANPIVLIDEELAGILHSALG
jgi:alcohol dehydrogenase class IV